MRKSNSLNTTKLSKINYKWFIIGIIVGILVCFFADIICNFTEFKESFMEGFNEARGTSIR